MAVARLADESGIEKHARNLFGHNLTDEAGGESLTTPELRQLLIRLLLIAVAAYALVHIVSKSRS